jgi:hypothetical protein
MIGITWPRIHPHSHLSLTEWLDTAVDKGLLEVHIRQPTM